MVDTLINIGVERAPRFSRSLVDKEDALRRLAEKCGSFTEVGLDTESSGPLLLKPQLTKAGNYSYKNFINMYRAQTSGWSIAFPDNTSYYVPMGHKKDNAPFWPARELLRKLVQSKRVRKYIHNVGHELLALNDLGIDTGHRDLACTQVLAWLTNHGVDGKHGLKTLARAHLRMEMATFEETVGKERRFDSLLPKHGLDYACDDAVAALLLGQKLMPVLRSWDLEPWFWGTEMPFVHVLRSMTDTGIVLDRAKVHHAHDVALERTEAARKAFGALTGGISPGSTKQMQELWERGWWPKDTPRAKSGWSTRADIVESLCHRLPEDSNGGKAARLLTEYRSLLKVVSTYSHSLLRLADQYPDGRLHPDYNHTGTATGRLSSSYPNGTNMPAWGEAAALVAQCLRGHGQSLGSADQSQIDLRLLAHVSGGELAEVYRVDGDVHQETADACGCARQQAKSINFAKVYGAWYKMLAKQIGASEREAKLFVQKYDRRYPDVVRVIKRIHRAAHERGYVKTVSGRRRYLPELKTERTRWSGERKSVNTVCQGGAADVVKQSMVDYYREGLHEEFPLQTQIHDDLRWVSPYGTMDKRSKEHAEEVKRIMESCWKLRVPLKADGCLGETWKDLK